MASEASRGRKRGSAGVKRRMQAQQREAKHSVQVQAQAQHRHGMQAHEAQSLARGFLVELRLCDCAP